MVSIEGDMVVGKLNERVNARQERPSVSLSANRGRGNPIGIMFDGERRDAFGTGPVRNRTPTEPDDEQGQLGVLRRHDRAIAVLGVSSDLSEFVG
jgi:hypothetical protein